jgi:hypothetical protein
MTFHRFTISLILGLLFFSACKKSESGNPPASLKEPVLASVQFDYSIFMEKHSFSYNADNLISTIKAENWETDSTKKSLYYTLNLEWNTDKTLKKVTNNMVNNPPPYTNDFVKTANQLITRKGIYPIGYPRGSQSGIRLDDKGRVIADTSYYAPSFMECSILTWDVNDNITRIDKYTNFGSGFFLDYSLECTYDNKKNPLYSYAPFFLSIRIGSFYDYQCKNNLLKEVYIKNGNRSDFVIYSYDYNEQNYPVKRTTAYSSINADTKNVIYTYK